MILMDMEFKKVSDELDIVTVNTSAAREHIAEIECRIRLIKEHTRSVISNLPFKFLREQMIAHLVYFVVTWLNAFLTAHVTGDGG